MVALSSFMGVWAKHIGYPSQQTMQNNEPNCIWQRIRFLILFLGKKLQSAALLSVCKFHSGEGGGLSGAIGTRWTGPAALSVGFPPRLRTEGPSPPNPRQNTRPGFPPPRPSPNHFVVFTIFHRLFWFCIASAYPTFPGNSVPCHFFPTHMRSRPLISLVLGLPPT